MDCVRTTTGEIITVSFLETQFHAPLSCVVNVEGQVEAHGGEIVYGWQVHNHHNIVEEHRNHAVWRSPCGMLFEITLQGQVTPEGAAVFWPQDTLFLPDETAVPLGQRPFRRVLPSRYLPLRPDRRLARACEWLCLADRAYMEGDCERERYYAEKANYVFHRHRLHFDPHPAGTLPF